MWVLMLASENIGKGQFPLFYERDYDFFNYIWHLVKKQHEAGAEHEAQLGQPGDARAAAEDVNKRLPLRAELDKVWYMFSHMILSNANLTADGYEQICTVLCENEFKVLIRQPFDGVVLFAAVSVEVGGSVSEIQRRMETLLTILTFLYGPSYDYCLGLEIRNLAKKQHDWNQISLLLNKWLSILGNEQCYLVEAIEEIPVGSIDGGGATKVGFSFGDKCDAILKDARQYIKSKLGIPYDFVIHTMLVVENKLVKCTSSEKDRVLSSYDQLLMMIFSMAYFPSNLATDDLMSRAYTKPEDLNSILREDSSEDLLTEGQSDSDVVSGTNRYYRKAQLPAHDDDDTSPDNQSLFSARSEDSAGLVADYNKRNVMFSVGEDDNDIFSENLDNEKINDNKISNEPNLSEKSRTVAVESNNDLKSSPDISSSNNQKQNSVKSNTTDNRVPVKGEAGNADYAGKAVNPELSKSPLSISINHYMDGRSGGKGSWDNLDDVSSITSRDTIRPTPVTDTDDSLLTGSITSTTSYAPPRPRADATVSDGLNGHPNLEVRTVSNSAAADDEEDKPGKLSLTADNNLDQPVLASVSSEKDLHAMELNISDDDLPAPTGRSTSQLLAGAEGPPENSNQLRLAENTSMNKPNVLVSEEANQSTNGDLPRNVDMTSLDKPQPLVSVQSQEDNTAARPEHADTVSNNKPQPLVSGNLSSDNHSTGPDNSSSGKSGNSISPEIVQGEINGNPEQADTSGYHGKQTYTQAEKVSSFDMNKPQALVSVVQGEQSVISPSPAHPPMTRARSITDSVAEASIRQPESAGAVTRSGTKQIESAETVLLDGEMSPEDRIPSPDLSDQSSTHTNASFNNSAAYLSFNGRESVTPVGRSLPRPGSGSASMPRISSLDSRSFRRGNSAYAGSLSSPSGFGNRSSHRPRHFSHRDRERRQSGGVESDGGVRSGGEDTGYVSAPVLSPSMLHRRSSGDSDASYHTTVSYVPSFPHLDQPFLDTESLLEEVHHYTQEMARKAAQNHDTPPSKDLVKDLYMHQRVFLKAPPSYDFIPACLYVVAISKGVNIIVAAETSDPQPPKQITDIITQLYHVLHPHRGLSTTLPDRIVDNMNSKLKDITDQLRARSTKKTHSDLCDNIMKRWQRDLQDMRVEVRRRANQSSHKLPDKLETTILFIIEKIKRIFFVLYMAVQPLEEKSRDVFDKLQIRTNHKLRFYKKILLVKAWRNIPITAFSNDRYPGLVHFLYIYRNKNIMKSPSIALSKDDTSMSAQLTRDMQVRMWRILPWIYRQLSNGYTSISVKDGDFIFTFDIYVYDEVHYKFFPGQLKNNKLYFPVKPAIGDLTAGFYKRLLKIIDPGAGLKLLELLTVHLAVTPRDTIYKQRTQLFFELQEPHNPFR